MNRDCQIADFADSSVPARFEKDQVSYLPDVRMCIGRSHCNARNPKALQIIDIVSNVGDLFQGQSAGSCKIPKSLSLVANSVRTPQG